MSPEAAVLGLVSAVRAVPLAVVYALLLAPRPTAPLVAYVAAGLTVSLGAGAAALALFGESSRTAEATTGRLVVDLVLGVIALGAAAASRSDRLHRRWRGGEPRRSPAAGRAGTALRERLRSPTPPAAALAGAVNNLPGLFYVAGLVAILETHPTPVGGAIQVLVYNALRFAVPIAALVLVLARPERTSGTVQAVHAWGARYRRGLVSAVLGLVGAYLVVKAVVGLLP